MKGRDGMLYSEFIEGTAAGDNMITWTVFSALNHIYMKNDTVTKEDCYEIGNRILNDLQDVARPVKIKSPFAFYHGGDEISYRCGACSFHINKKFKFCPWCGCEILSE